jgi:serine/threonine-protein kinase
LGSDTLEIIERCLEEDPQARPASVLDVAAALPGGDPIAAALRAGRAPSVDAVANVQSVASLRPWKAWLLASVTMMGFLLFALFGSTKTLWGRSAPQLAPAALEDRAKETLSDLGVALPTGSTMQRFLHDGEYLAREGPPMALASDGPVPVLYEFRASPGQLVRQGPVATKHDPPMVVPGEVRVVLDVHGHLRLFERVPEARTAEVGEPDWSAALKRAGVVAAHPTEPQDVPPRAVDVLVAWRGEMAGAQVLVEAAAWRGVPVWFRAKVPWSGTSERTISDDEDTDLVNVLVLLLFLVGLGLLARRSYKRGEVDGRGALRVAVVLGVSVTLSELMTMAVGRAHGFDTFFGMAQEGLLVAAISLLGYAVVEPYGRRFMPGAMVSWIRVTRGRWRDPLVGRDILVGAALGCVIGALSLARQFSGEGGVLLARLDALMGLRHAAGATLGAVSMGAFSVMQVYVLFLIIRWVTRRTSVAVGGFCLVWGLVEVSRLAHASLEPEAWAVGILSSLAISVVLAYTIVRVGLLGLSAAQVLLNLVLRLPVSLELSGWYSTVSLVVLSATTVIVLGALYVALGRAQARERGGSTSRTRV